MNCRQIAIINDKIIGSGIHTYSQGDLDALVRDGWTPIYNGVENYSDGIYTQIRVCE